MDAKTRKDLLQYLSKKKYVSKNVPVDDATVSVCTRALDGWKDVFVCIACVCSD